MKLCASFCSHWWIETGVTVRKHPILGKIRQFLEPCDLEIWRMTLKNNRAPLLCYLKLCPSFCSHWWIQTGVTVRKWLSWVLTFVTLTFDLWPWPFARTSLLSLVITPDNFMMIRWWEHSQKGVTDRQTDRRTDRKYHSLSCLVAAKNEQRDNCFKLDIYPTMCSIISKVFVDDDFSLCYQRRCQVWHW